MAIIREEILASSGRVMPEEFTSFDRLFLNTLLGCSRVLHLREFAKTGKPSAADAAFRRLTQHTVGERPSDQFAEDEAANTRLKAFLISKVLRSVDASLDAAQSSIDAASVVFAHSVLDDVASQACQMSLQTDPDGWTQEILECQVTIKELQERSYNNILSALRARYVRYLEGRAVMARIELLEKKCQPAPPLVITGAEYKYNRNRISSFDKLRHEIIHQPNQPKFILSFPSTLEDDLYFVRNTCFYVLWMLRNRYNMPMTEEWTTEIY